MRGYSYGKRTVLASGPYHRSMKYRHGILERDGHQCQVCGCRMGEWCQLHPHLPVVNLDVGHIIPWADGGPSEDWNLRAECASCNLMHATRPAAGPQEETMEEYLAYLEQWALGRD